MKQIPNNIFVEQLEVKNKWKAGQDIFNLRMKQFEDDAKPYTDPVEQNEVRKADRIRALNEALEDGIKKYNGDFYVACLRRKEPLMQEIIRSYWVTRESCPSPNFDQDVIKFDRTSMKFELLWSIPDQHTCQHLIDNRLLLDEEDKKLFTYIDDYANGRLHILSMRLNREIE